jgi:ssDNA-binding protein
MAKFICQKSERSGNITVGPVRVCFESINEPKQNERGDDRWGGCFLVPKGEDLAALKAELREVAVARWGDKIPKFRHGSPVKDQEDLTTSEGDLYDFSEPGAMFFNANSNEEIGAYKKNKQGAYEKLDRSEIYGGMWAYVSLRPYAWPSAKNEAAAKGNRGISLGLQQVLKVRDDERLGKPVAKPEEDFEDFETEAAESDTGKAAESMDDIF